MNYTDIHTSEHALQDYYKLHSPVYDATRWSFLFGRRKLLGILPDLPPNPRILEIGCGTGTNIAALEYSFPDARIIGIDLSADMLQKADQKVGSSPHVQFLNEKYEPGQLQLEPFNLIVLSYSLTMMGENIESILQQTANDLSHNGYIAVVDFHSTPFNWFKNWMKANHVKLDGSLLPLLKKYYTPLQYSVHSAYLGLWSYFLYLGQQG